MPFLCRYRDLNRLILLLFLGGAWHCGDRPQTPVASAPTGSIVLQVEPAPAAAKTAKVPAVRGRLRITGDGMIPRDTTLAVIDGRISGRLDGVPVGPRRVTLTLEGADEADLWRAETDVEVRGGRAATALLTLARIGDLPPTVRFLEPPVLVEAGTPFILRLDMEDRHDAVDLLRARWDLDGDGTFETDWTAASQIGHTYPEKGSYEVKLEVRDPDGLIGETTHRLLATQLLEAPLPGGATMPMVWIGPGRFWMGAAADEADQDPDESPQRQIEITRGFYIGQYEVTHEQWRSVMGTEPWAGSGWAVEHPRSPAANITWEAAQEFIARLNAFEGADLYRLPTEAEWEYAARAGNGTAFHYGDDVTSLEEFAWFTTNACLNIFDCNSRLIGQYPPNAWRLYDMHGNVWEWVQDWYDPTYYAEAPATDPQGPPTGTNRVRRGGGFFDEGRYLRAANRGARDPTRSDWDMGLRVVRQEP